MPIQDKATSTAVSLKNEWAKLAANLSENKFHLPRPHNKAKTGDEFSNSLVVYNLSANNEAHPYLELLRILKQAGIEEDKIASTTRVQ